MADTKKAGGIRIKPAKRDKIRFNLMVVGESGMGKTTFLQALLRKYVEECKVESPELPINDKTLSIAKVGKFEVSTETGDALDIVLYDSPGYGDFINNQEAVDKVKKHIFQCHQQWRALDAQSMTEAEFLQADDRIHCVFYFLASHRMKEIDREFITQLSTIVPIVPIIGKADTMTVKERNSYIQTVKTKLDEISAKFGEKCIYDFDGDDLTAGDGSTGSASPSKAAQSQLVRAPNVFACVCDASKERVYPWGTLNIDSGLHSDFRRLQTIIFENDRHLKGMMDQTRNKTIKLFRKPPPPAPAPAPVTAPVAAHKPEPTSHTDASAAAPGNGQVTRDMGKMSIAGPGNTGAPNDSSPDKNKPPAAAGGSPASAAITRPPPGPAGNGSTPIPNSAPAPAPKAASPADERPSMFGNFKMKIGK